MSALFGPLRDIRPTDVVDILLVTALVYTATVWIRRTQAALVAAGILILGAVYVAARALGLQLLAWIFQGFFAIFLIIIVVVFQEELRQIFERIAVWSLGRRRRAATPAADPADVLVQCLSDFARDRIGALVVLPGRQPINRHVDGGIDLNGRLSAPMLKSIFDPHSPGHDGAVIVEGDHISRFATHLPLSSDFRQLAGVGTRHSAALGLAELTDALCLVVSEERGRISAAQDGHLRTLADPHELVPIVRRFVDAQRPQARLRGGWRGLVREHWVEKLGSFVAVVALWYLFVPGSRPTQASFEVPVYVTNVPAGYEIEEVKPTSIEATFSGPARAFYLVDRNGFAVNVDATLARFGRRSFDLTEGNVRRPRDLNVVDIHPTQVRVAVRKAAMREAKP